MFDLLDQYNRRERNYVANYFISGVREGSLCLSPDFLRRLGICVGMGESLVGARYYAAFEFNYDWLYAVLKEYYYNLIFPQPRFDQDFIRGKINSDIDLLVVVYNELNNQYDFFLVESKYKLKWDKAQIDNKLNLLKKILSLPQNTSVGDFYYIFCSGDDIDNSRICDYAKKNFSTMKHFRGFHTMILQPKYKQKDEFFQKLEQQDRKEMSVLARDALKQDVLNNVDLQASLYFSFGIDLNQQCYVSVDYPFAGLFNSLGIKSKSSLCATDCDALIVNKGSKKYDVVLIEGKHYSDWNPKQIKEKFAFIEDLATKIESQKINLYFVQFGKKYKYSKYLKSKFDLIAIDFDSISPQYRTRFATQRCNLQRKPDINGEYWNKKACDV